MKYFICLLTLFATTAFCADTDCEPNRFGDVPTDCQLSDETRDVFGGFIPAQKKVEGTWELTLIKVDGEFVDLNEPSMRFGTRNDCMRNAIYRMQWALDYQNKALRTDRGSVATYTQYLGFICEEVTEDEAGK